MYILIYSIPDVLINSYLITALVPLKKNKDDGGIIALCVPYTFQHCIIVNQWIRRTVPYLDKPFKYN